MENLSIEEKAKRYDEALTKARNIVNSINVGLIGKDSFEAVFPELAESEDAMVGREIIDFINHRKAMGSITPEESKRTGSWIAWLERQGEQKCTAEEVLIKAGLKPYKDGDQWCILLGDNIQEGICGFGDTIDDALYAFLNDLIKSQKEQKPTEWSEEDKKKISELKTFIAQCNGFNKVNRQKAFNLIDALSPHNTWKPSEEQIEELKYLLDDINWEGEILVSLYNDLKKLREE